MNQVIDLDTRLRDIQRVTNLFYTDWGAAKGEVIESVFGKFPSEHEVLATVNRMTLGEVTLTESSRMEIDAFLGVKH